MQNSLHFTVLAIIRDLMNTNVEIVFVHARQQMSVGKKALFECTP